MSTSRILFVLLFFFSLLPGARAEAQQPAGSGPVYVVQPGDTLWDIAQRFRVSVDEMVRANRLTDAGQISVGDQLVIPGLDGVDGRLVTIRANFGESLVSLSRRYQIPLELLARLNALTSPAELHVGFNLIVPEGEAPANLGGRDALLPGESLLELAARQGSSPYTIADANGLAGTWSALPGDVLQIPGEGDQGPAALPGQVLELALQPLPMVQGRTAVIKVSAAEDLILSGSLAGRPLQFFQDSTGDYYALQGINAMTAPGVYPLSLQGSQTGSNTFDFTQNVYVRAGSYPQAPDLVVDEAGLDPAITRPEDERWSALAGHATGQRRWDGPFEFPSPRIYLEQYTARFGERRTYNNSAQLYFHTGLDIPGQTGTEVYATAPGEVIFAGNLDVRGNAMMIDHGWGVYSAYMHLSEFRVEPGEQVETGQLIALVGNTGLRTTGSHLHWEVLVGGVQVDPLEWMEQDFP